MNELERLLADYKEAWRAGAGDPRPFLERAAPADRELLATYIRLALGHAAALGYPVPGADRSSRPATGRP